MIWLFALLQVADLDTTLLALGGGYPELNPVARALAGLLGVGLGLVLPKALVLGATAAARRRLPRWIVLVALTITGLTVVNNLTAFL